MLSRVADTLYWMRRYIERADQIARVIDVNLDLAFDRAPADVARLWGRLLSALWPAPEWAQIDRGSTGGVLSDLASVDAVASCVAAARENARQVRQHISGEMWERVNGLHLVLNDRARRTAWEEQPHVYFQTVREGAALFDAAAGAGMIRDEGWHFLQLGLFLERAGATARLLDCQLREMRAAGGPADELDQQLDWICLLRACDALEPYHRRHQAELDPDRIVRFLLDDPLSPRTVRYAFDAIGTALAALAASSPGQPAVDVRQARPAAIGAGWSADDPLAAVEAIEVECDRLHRAIYESYIEHRLADAPAGGEAAWTTL